MMPATRVILLSVAAFIGCGGFDIPHAATGTALPAAGAEATDAVVAQATGAAQPGPAPRGDVAPSAPETGPVGGPGPSRNAEMERLKRAFLDLRVELETETRLRRELETKLIALQDRVDRLVSGDLTELQAAIDRSQGDLPSTIDLSQEMLDRLGALETDLMSLREQLDTAPSAVGVLAPGNGDLRQDSFPGAVGSARFRVLVDADGNLRSFYLRDIANTDVAQLVAEHDCAVAGDWLEKTFDRRDYNAFFVRTGQGIGVCERGSLGWRPLRAATSKRAHLLMEAE